MPQQDAKDSTKVRLNLDLDGALDGLSLLLLSGDGLGTHDTTAPVTTALLVFGGVTFIDGGDEFAELGLVLALDLGERDHGGGLLVHDRAETGLALDDGIGDTHFAAQSGQEDDELNGVNVVGDQDQRGFLVLNQSHHMVETVLDNVGFLVRWIVSVGRKYQRIGKCMVVSAYLAGILLLLSLLDGGGLGEESLLLLDLGFRSVLVKELEGLGGGVAVKGVLELSNGRWDLQAQVEDLLLALQADILWPSRQEEAR